MFCIGYVEHMAATGIPMAVPSFFNQKVSSYWNMYSCLGVQLRLFWYINFSFFSRFFMDVMSAPVSMSLRACAVKSFVPLAREREF